VRLCKNGEWQQVTIDDHFPVVGENDIAFSLTNDSSFWLLIL